MSTRKIRVGVLFGGRSAEHEVSLMSARAVLAAIDRDRYEVVPIGVTRDGRWVLLQDPQLSREHPVALADGTEITLLPTPVDPGPRTLTAGSGKLPPLDVIFPLIHGTFGEDGTVQGLFELADIPYVGAGVLGSAVGMDKAAMKALLVQAGLPVAPYRVVLRRRWQQDPDAVRAECEALGYPLFVKPANLGSSVGISKVHGPDEFAPALDEAARYDRKLVVEQGIEDAHEVEVSVLGNDEPQASVPGEIVPCNEFYDYAAKYLAGTSELIIPAPLPEAVIARLQDHAVRAFHALDCAGLARVDFLVRRADHAPFILEANTLPGFTPISMYPKLWAASGLPYDRLIDRLIQLALERHRERQSIQTAYLPQ
ncbi:MAG: D-alanine--D-alanine ligase family protein [Candidatus Competibacterales bacterium]|nr:D-alanine--D-alanine ligase family protein [Candidatus Competibacterales bacterium]